MKFKRVTFLMLVVLASLLVMPLASSSQSIYPSGGSQFAINSPASEAKSNNIVPPSSFASQSYPYAPEYGGAGNAGYSPGVSPGYSPMVSPGMSPGMPPGVASPYGVPYGEACGAGVPCDAAPVCGVPCAAPGIVAGPYTAGFTYAAQESSAFGPFAPPVSQASEEFLEYPGLTPCGPYPGSGFAATRGVGFDPVSGYYGPFGAYSAF